MSGGLTRAIGETKSNPLVGFYTLELTQPAAGMAANGHALFQNCLFVLKKIPATVDDRTQYQYNLIYQFREEAYESRQKKPEPLEHRE